MRHAAAAVPCRPGRTDWLLPVSNGGGGGRRQAPGHLIEVDRDPFPPDDGRPRIDHAARTPDRGHSGGVWRRRGRAAPGQPRGSRRHEETGRVAPGDTATWLQETRTRTPSVALALSSAASGGVR